jgi:hypothetical protein
LNPQPWQGRGDFVSPTGRKPNRWYPGRIRRWTSCQFHGRLVSKTIHLASIRLATAGGDAVAELAGLGDVCGDC